MIASSPTVKGPVNIKQRQGTSSKQVRDVAGVYTRASGACRAFRSALFFYFFDILTPFNFQQIPPILVPKIIPTAPAASEVALPTKDKENTDKPVCTYTSITCQLLFNESSAIFFFNCISFLSLIWK